jgi:hypothetical protein
VVRPSDDRGIGALWGTRALPDAVQGTSHQSPSGSSAKRLLRNS